MKIRNLGLMAGAVALAIWGIGCDQPQIDCRVLHGDFVAKYTLTSGGPECSGLVGDVIGVQSYYAAASDRKTADLTRSLLAIRAAELPGLVDEAETFGDDTTVTKQEFNAVSDFKATEPDEGNACAVTDTMTAEVSVNAIPANAGDPMDPDDDYPGRPATTIKYEWKNVRVLVEPSNPGNMVEAELQYTVNGCSATYNVVAIAPVIDCQIYDENGDGTGMGDNDLCDDKPDPKYGLSFGSGISPDLKPTCDPNLLLCVGTNTSLLAGNP